MVAHPGSARTARSARRLNAPRPALVEAHADGMPRRVNRQGVAVVREEWRDRRPLVDGGAGSTAATSTSCSRRARTPSSTATASAGRGSRSGPDADSIKDAFPARGGVGDERRREPEPSRSSAKLAQGRAPYVELHAHSAYSFLDGASLPEELAARAAELGYDALALTDHDGVYGSLEFAHAAKHFGVRAITGAEVTLERRRARHAALRDAARLREPLPDPHRRARAARGCPAGSASCCRPRRRIEVVAEHAEGLVCLSGCARHGLGVVDPNARRPARARVSRRVLRRAAAAVRARRRPPQRRARRARRRRSRVPTVATGDVHAHHLRRARLQDALVAIRNRTSLDGCERERRGNHEAVLLAPAEMLERLPRDAAARTREVADRCAFDLTQELGYRYPDFSDGADPADVQLREICDRAFAERYANANGHKRRARERLDDELALIARLGLAGFFLLHWEVLELARECALEVRGPGSPRHALPPGRGRGSSVGSIVCYLTGPLARRPGRGGPLARPLPQRRDGRRCPTSTSTSRATSARS